MALKQNSSVFFIPHLLYSNVSHSPVTRTRVAPLESHFLDLTYKQWLLDMTESARKTARMIMIILMVILLLLLQRSYRWSMILRCVARYIQRCLFCDKARGWNDSQYFKIVLHLDKCQEIRCVFQEFVSHALSTVIKSHYCS